MVNAFLDCVGMNKNGKRTSIYSQPWYECTKLCWREDIDFKHGHGVGADGLFPESVDSQLWEFPPNAFPKVSRMLHLFWVALKMVDVDVTAVRTVG